MIINSVNNSIYTKRAELHCHDKSNMIPYLPFLYESVMTVEEILFTAVEKGISILSITSHESLNGYYKAKQIIEKQKLPLLLISGSEITSTEGHILAYGITREIPRDLTPEETIRRIHKQGGIAVAPHPYLSVFNLGDKARMLPFDAIEGYNASIPFFPEKSMEKAIALAKKMGKPCTAGSDAHEKQFLGTACMLFRKNVRAEQDVLLAIRKGDFVVEYKRNNTFRIIIEHLRGAVCWSPPLPKRRQGGVQQA